MPPNSDMAPRPTNDVNSAGLRKKQVLVVVLVIALIITLLTQPDDSESVESALASVPINAMASVNPSVVSTPVSTKSVSAKPMSACASRLQKVGMGTKEYDPKVLCEIRKLSRVDLVDMLELELLAPEFERLQEPQVSYSSEVRAVYATAQGRTALVGESIVRGGDSLPGGGTVLRVTEEGVQVGSD